MHKNIHLLIGNGRLARHFSHYFALLKLPFFTWTRQESAELLQQYLKQATHVLLLMSDDAIEAFITEHLSWFNGIKIHCSGSLVTKLAFGAHPLQNFNLQLYTLEQYQAIPFVIDDNAPEFEILMPGLPNDSVRLNTEKKAKYHALCVMSGNFSCLLWQKLFLSLEQEFNLPPKIAHAYLRQHTENLIENYEAALTGPLTRHDQKTIAKNLKALEGDPIQKIYQSFVEYYDTCGRFPL